MTDAEPGAPEPGSSPKASRWSRLWQRPRSRWLLGIPIGAFLACGLGAVLLASFITAVEVSSTEKFCISCHEMSDTVYVEYKETIHYSNRTGVRATCPDCHVPKAWIPKMIRKIQAATNELPKHFIGFLNTKEKFEAHRLTMAESVWKSMRKRDSQECRNCHAIEHMDLAVQDKSARRKHGAVQEGKNKDTCIDCHQGIAHTLPEIDDEIEVSGDPA